ncbi:restriction endonuclease subunit S [Arthrobacter wenxiniae]|uniref:Type I restriction modification DNA specificity domain-containing protein n=1 Tax=Arthrobacter wenxiniae TaxID=2713570 RepID=A0A7Y7M0T3_9MICC|nr:restriction endonuclease subunit S [Arthrobacter wenxiniae]NVM96369.1 hypothetical protein [Arthrobacter wenxiniae]
MSQWKTYSMRDVTNITDFVANGSFESLRVNVNTSTELGFAILVRLVDHNSGWKGQLSYVDEASYTFLKKSRLEPGDVVVSNVGANAGTVFRVPNLGMPVTLGPNSVVCHPLDPSVLDRRFLYYMLVSPLGQSLLGGIISGSAQPKFNKTSLRQLQIPLPPLEEQQAIAEVLGALDDKIAANTKLAATAHELAALIYEQATSPMSIVPMSSVLSPVLGGTPPRSREDFWGGDRLWASAKDITGADFYTVVDTDEKISQSAVEKTKAKPLPAGSVILTARGTVGAVARLAVPASFNQSCYGFVPGTVPAGVLYFSIVNATKRAKAIAHGSVFDTITMKTFDHLEFPDFRGGAMSKMESKITPFLDAITGAVLENRCLAATRDALLPQLMSGKLRVKDAEALVSAAV